jgi:hypothetical protein
VDGPLLGAECGYAGRLRSRGSVLIADHHPVWEILTVRGENQLTITGDYFGRGTPRSSPDPAKQPFGARDEHDRLSFAAFVWPVSNVVMLLVPPGCGLMPSSSLVGSHTAQPSLRGVSVT